MSEYTSSLSSTSVLWVICFRYLNGRVTSVLTNSCILFLSWQVLGNWLTGSGLNWAHFLCASLAFQPLFRPGLGPLCRLATVCHGWKSHLSSPWMAASLIFVPSGPKPCLNAVHVPIGQGKTTQAAASWGNTQLSGECTVAGHPVEEVTFLMPVEE